MEPFWEPAPQAVKYESDTTVSGYATYCGENGLNFSASVTTYSEDDTDFNPGRRGKASRQDPLSHRIIEKRRRDRMNSCLADLSRLIPPQYQRKGRGRIEKTEIIEMSIRYMKQLQNQEYGNRESVYKMGYDDCLQAAADYLFKFNGHRDICFRMVDHLNHIQRMKSDCKLRNHASDSLSVSSDSPPSHSYHHPITPLNQLHDMLSASPDHHHEHSNHSNDDHNDVKDLSLRNQPQQAPVITSTAPVVHLDTSSNPDFDSSASRSSSAHLESNGNESVLRTVRMRKLSDSSHPDNEHNSNSYKFKNYIQQRFSQDVNHHDDISVITDCSNKSPCPPDAPCLISGKKRRCLDYLETSSSDEKPTTNGIAVDMKPSSELINGSAFPIFSKPAYVSNVIHNPVPVFALHSQGKFYVPLSIEYDALLPYLNGHDYLLEKSGGSGGSGGGGGGGTQMPPLHSININVSFNSNNNNNNNNNINNNININNHNNNTNNNTARLKLTTCHQPSSLLRQQKLDINGW